jgi:anti-anti-sigma factor
VLDFSGVRFINSSNLAKLLRVRKNQIGRNGKLILCGINNTIWSTLLVTGLDQVFDFGEDVATGLARIQMAK